MRYLLALVLVSCCWSRVNGQDVSFRAIAPDAEVDFRAAFEHDGISFAAMTPAKKNDRPVVYVYSPPDCVACRIMYSEVGTGDNRVQIKWVKNPDEFPQFVRSYSTSLRPGSNIANGYPVIHYRPEASKTNGRIVAGRKTLDELHTMISTPPATP